MLRVAQGKKKSFCSLHRMKKSAKIYHLLLSHKTEECSQFILLEMRGTFNLKTFRSVTLSKN